MAFSKLDQLYREVVLDHSSHPRNKGLVGEERAHTIELMNPTCGDMIQLQVLLDDQGTISQAHFDGYGCSISTASASMLTEIIKGKTLDQAKLLAQDFSKLIQGEEVDNPDLGDAALLAGVAQFPARIKCASLAWKALDQSIQEWKKERED